MLEHFFQPESIAVVGASRTPGKIGHDLLKNLLDAGFKGKIYPVNPKAEDILNIQCHPSLAAIGRRVDLAVIVLPAKLVPQVVEECGEAAIDSIIVISAGFKETGEEGKALEKQLTQLCHRYGIRCLGPNCLGVISPLSGVNASFSATTPRAGNVAFFSQSGALGTAVLDWFAGEETSEGLGISRFASYGNKADVDESDLIEALGQDPETDVILGYVESISDGGKFMKAARKVTGKKPVIILKSGRTDAGARAASSHTGSLAGSDTAYEAAFKQSGVIRARSVTEFFDYVLALSRQGPPAGPNTVIITNAGGPGILATDTIESLSLKMARLSEGTTACLKEKLPSDANISNPIDIIGDARADRYQTALQAVIGDENVDGIVVLITPQTSTEVEETAEVIGELALTTSKPVLASFMGSHSAGKGSAVLEQKGVPNYSHPERAVITLDGMYRVRSWQEKKIEPAPRFDLDQDQIGNVLKHAEDRELDELGERQARKILGGCGIPLPRSILAETEEEAAAAAAEIGSTVVMKVASHDILHKSDAGGVRLGLRTEHEVRAAFNAIMDSARSYDPDAAIEGVLVQTMVKGGTEVIVGMNRDPQFGPLIMFGLGGIYVELLKDVSFRVAPLTATDAREMVRDIRTIAILKGARGEKPGDLEALEDCLLRISQLAMDYPDLAECDINPLLVFERGRGVCALDARFRVEPVP